MRDLLIAGGGPIGLATALYAVRAGLDVTVREPRTGVIDKACGEGLMPGAVASLHDLGVHLDGAPITGVRYVDRHHQVDAEFMAGPGLGVRRTVLHAALRERLRASEVVVVEAPVTHLEDRGDHVLVDGEPVRHVIAADGLHSSVRRLLGLDVPRAASRRYGQRVHVQCEPWTSLVEVHWAGAGEAYVTPVGPDEIGVAVLSAHRRPFDELLEDFPFLCERITGRARSSVRGAGPLRQRSLRRVQGRALLVGDAAGYVDALTGEGLAVGMAQARAAVDAVASGNPAAYEQAWRRVRRRHDALTLGLVTATRVPAVRRAVVPAARLAPAVFRAAVNQLARPA